VHSFEPSSRNYYLLQSNIQKNNIQNAVINKKALGDSIRYDTLYLDHTNYGGNSMCANNINQRHKDSINIQVDTIDNYYNQNIKPNKIDFIKMDIEGAEALVLIGAKEVLSQTPLPYILMEYWPKGILNFGYNPLTVVKDMENLGYHISFISKQEGLVDTDVTRIGEWLQNIQNDRQYINVLFSPV
jgi:FkbM family methyltransferase